MVEHNNKRLKHTIIKQAIQCSIIRKVVISRHVMPNKQLITIKITQQ